MVLSLGAEIKPRGRFSLRPLPSPHSPAPTAAHLALHTRAGRLSSLGQSSSLSRPTPENATSQHAPVRKPSSFRCGGKALPPSSPAQNLLSHLLSLPLALARGTSTFQPLTRPSGEKELTRSPAPTVSLRQSHLLASPHLSCWGLALPQPRPLSADTHSPSDASTPFLPGK